jgi:hypothetical protein
MVALKQAPPMFLCGGDPFWDDNENVADTIPMVTCLDCDWTGFAGSPEEGEIKEAAEERAAGGWWPDPTFQYGDNHTEVACRSWRRDHEDDPRLRLPGKRGRAHALYRKGHERHPAVPLQRRGDGELACPRCGFVP